MSQMRRTAQEARSTILSDSEDLDINDYDHDWELGIFGWAGNLGKIWLGISGRRAFKCGNVGLKGLILKLVSNLQLKQLSEDDFKNSEVHLNLTDFKAGSNVQVSLSTQSVKDIIKDFKNDTATIYATLLSNRVLMSNRTASPVSNFIQNNTNLFNVTYIDVIHTWIFTRLNQDKLI